MKYIDENCEIKFENNKLMFIGKMEKSDYEDVGKFLHEINNIIITDSIEIDLQHLNFLNSSGIRILAVFVLECSKKIRIKIDKKLTWQRVGIVPLSRIKPDNSIIID